MVAVYKGSFGPDEARRLLDRAGFGPRPGQEEKLARMGMRKAVHSLTRPVGPPILSGHAPRDQNGLPIAPIDATGHDHLWWLDRMVRSNQSLVERMALIFHDWFATNRNGVSLQRHSINQSNLFRSRWQGSFLKLFEQVTIDPAMLVWLNGNKNYKGHPNENYGREMMELFSLGAKRGYTEEDVRQMARTLTGWTSTTTPELGAHDFRFEKSRHDYGIKTVLGKTGRWNWRDGPRLCVENENHPSFFINKLWSYFVDSPPSDRVRRDLTGIYVGNDWRIRPVVEAILMHPDFYESGPMVKPPVVHLASMLRARRRKIDTDAWISLCDRAGQQLFEPPDVSGWNDARWLDTARLQARWDMVHEVNKPYDAGLENPYPGSESPAEAVRLALQAWGNPPIDAADRAELINFAERSAALATTINEQSEFRRLRQQGLTQLIGIGPSLVLQ